MSLNPCQNTAPQWPVVCKQSPRDQPVPLASLPNEREDQPFPKQIWRPLQLQRRNKSSLSEWSDTHRQFGKFHFSCKELQDLPKCLLREELSEAPVTSLKGFQNFCFWTWEEPGITEMAKAMVEKLSSAPQDTLLSLGRLTLPTCDLFTHTSKASKTTALSRERAKDVKTPQMLRSPKQQESC